MNLPSQLTIENAHFRMGIVFLNEKNEAAETRRHVFAKPKNFKTKGNEKQKKHDRQRLAFIHFWCSRFKIKQRKKWWEWRMEIRKEKKKKKCATLPVNNLNELKIMEGLHQPYSTLSSKWFVLFFFVLFSLSVWYDVERGLKFKMTRTKIQNGA